MMGGCVISQSCFTRILTLLTFISMLVAFVITECWFASLFMIFVLFISSV